MDFDSQCISIEIYTKKLPDKSSLYNYIVQYTPELILHQFSLLTHTAKAFYPKSQRRSLHLHCINALLISMSFKPLLSHYYYYLSNHENEAVIAMDVLEGQSPAVD